MVQYFREWLHLKHADVRYVDEVTVELIREYVEFMLVEKEKWGGHQIVRRTSTGLSPVTINIRLRTAKCFFRWLAKEGICTDDPTSAIHLLRTEEDRLRGFSDDEVQKLLMQPDQNTYVGYRDFALYLLLLDVGARISETLALEVSAFDFDRRTVYFPASTTKTRKGRTLPLSKRTAEVLSELIAENRDNFGSEKQFVFLTVTGEPLERQVVRSRLHAYGKQAGITNCRVSPHTFRHTFARMYIQNGGDAFSLQRLLGHSSMDMVRKYIQLQQGDLEQSHERFSPVQRFRF